jgi:hypothetical protein
VLEITVEGFGRDFECEATIEIIKLAVSSTLKAATKISVGGEAGIEGTFEPLPRWLRSKEGVRPCPESSTSCRTVLKSGLERTWGFMPPSTIKCRVFG